MSRADGHRQADVGGRSTGEFVSCAGREIHVRTWGHSTLPAVAMWHGIARTGRDFDTLAAVLSDRFFVLCPDMIGRGLSEWATDPPREYTLEFYSAIAVDLLEHFEIDRCAWLGTSMGGLLGILTAGGPLKDRIASLVINDVGPLVPRAASARIAAYAAQPPAFARMSELDAWFRDIYAPFGWQEEEFWQTLRETSYRRLEDGRVCAHFDPRVAIPLAGLSEDVDLWPVYDQIGCPVLLVRGACSDVLPAHVAQEMTERGPRARLHTFSGCAHAPTLCAGGQIAVVSAFLNEMMSEEMT